LTTVTVFAKIKKLQLRKEVRIMMTRKKKAKPLKYRVQEIARERGIENSFQLMKYADISPNTSKVLWNGVGHVTTNSLSLVADVFGVEVNDLIVGSKEKKGQEEEGDGGTMEGNIHPVGRAYSYQSASRPTGYPSTMLQR
jgi:DNA-binding Xre family transcriptional regulator